MVQKAITHVTSAFLSHPLKTVLQYKYEVG